MWDSISGALGVVAVVLVALTVVGLARVALNRPAGATGDPGLAAALDQVAGRRTRRLAAVTLDLARETPCRMAFVDADAHTRFEIGSVGKGLTGLLVADAVDRGEITLATTLGSLSPRYAGGAVSSATVEQLCTHTSGLPSLPRSPGMLLRSLGAVWFGLDPYHRLTVDDVARAARRARLRTVGRYEYSNLGAAVLGNAVADHAGSGYAELLDERVLAPLGMSGTSAARGSRSAVPRGWTAQGRRSMPWRPSGYAPAGDVTSTATDLATLAEALLRGQAPGAGALAGLRPGPGASTQAMFWIIDSVAGSDRTEIWHNGQTGGYSAFVALYPQTRRAVIVLADVADAQDQQRIATHLVRWTVANGADPGRDPRS